MTTFKPLILVALTGVMLVAGSGAALAGLGDFAAWPPAAPGVAGGTGEIASPGDAFYPNGAPQSREERCHAAGGEVVVQIEDGRTYRVCIL
jgi:hypothetical protein